jgi:ubiquinone/menaquinone biosynthesis C-methylase UbiE
MGNRFREQWEANAAAFTDLIAGSGTPHHRQILNPCIEQLLGDVRGKRLLDAGCGEGYLSRYYARKGASVTAVDLSERLIETARSLTEREGIVVKYRVDDICHLDSISDSEFDIVLANLVLLNVPCFRETLREFYRVLRTGGHLVFSIVHPAFNSYGPGSWEMGERNPETGRREGVYFKVDQYFDEKEYERYWTTRSGERFPAAISFFHRTLGTYLNTLFASGFNLVAFREPQPTVDDAFFDREQRVPFFAVFKAEKR